MNYRDAVAAVTKRHAGVLGTNEASLKLVSADIPDVDIDKREVTVVSTAECVDLDGEVVLSSGADTDYYAPRNKKGIRSVFLNHDTTKLIGTTRDMVVENGRIVSVIYLSRTSLGQDVLTMVAEGVMRGVSIGFHTLESSAPTDVELRKWAGARNMIRKWLMLEQSFTGMPCNPEAVVELVNAGKILRSSADEVRQSPDLTQRRNRRIVLL